MHENACRVCLDGTENQLTDLFSYEDAENHAQKLTYIAGVEVLENDQLPQKICFNCLQKVDAACEIKEKCFETDQLLRMTLKDEPKEVEPQVEFRVGTHPEWIVDYGDYEASNFVKTKHEEVVTEDETVHEEYLAEYNPIYQREPSPKKKTPTVGRKKPQEFQKARAEDYSCVFCEKSFKKLVDKKKHVKVDHAEEIQCRICHKQRGSVLATERCLRDHQFGFLFLCQICARPFNRKYLLDKHIEETHNDNRIMFGCDLCGAKIRHKNSLQRHMRTVHTDERIPCPYTDLCPDVLYTTKNSLRIHLYRVHDAPAPLSCKNCNSGFSNATELNAHMKYGCRILSKPETQRKAYNSFQARGSLQQYYNIIDGNFHCKLCPKVHVSKKNFSDHFQNYHKDNKTCKICNKTFNQFNTFRMHVKVVHEKVKNYVCDYPGCGKTFGRGHGLNVHRNTHTGEKPYSCPFCNYRTGDNATLCKHKKKMHSNVQLEAM